MPLRTEIAGGHARVRMRPTWRLLLDLRVHKLYADCDQTAEKSPGRQYFVDHDMYEERREKEKEL